MVGRDEPLVLRVPLDVARDERAKRHHLETLAARILESDCGEAAAETAALARGVNLRVGEGDTAVSAVVGREPDQLSVEPKLVTTGLGDIDDLGVRR